MSGFSDKVRGMIGIVDYGMGNLRSVQKGFERVGSEAIVVRSPGEIADVDRLVLPGVGAFRDAIHELKRLDLVPAIKDHIAADKPFLGICLGLQMLFDVGYEDGEHEGLGIFRGSVQRFSSTPGLKIPHMGWNTLEFKVPTPAYAGLPPEATFYFVHSYFVVPEDPAIIATTTTHGTSFVSSVARSNLLATQFHPEKSQNAGLRLLQNFAGTAKKAESRQTAVAVQ